MPNDAACKDHLVRTQETNDAASDVVITHTGQPTTNRTNANLLQDSLSQRRKSSTAAQQKEGSGWTTAWRATTVDLALRVTQIYWHSNLLGHTNHITELRQPANALLTNDRVVCCEVTHAVHILVSVYSRTFQEGYPVVFCNSDTDRSTEDKLSVLSQVR